MWAALTLSSWLRPVALEVLSQIHRSIDQNNACVRHGFVSTTVGSNGSKDDWFMVLISLFHQFMDQVQMRPRNYYCLHCLLFFFTTWIRNVFFKSNSQALNGQAPRSPADDGPASICANEGEMCPAVECQHYMKFIWFTASPSTFDVENHGDHGHHVYLQVFARCNHRFCFRCQCKGKAYYGRKLPLHGKVRALREFGRLTPMAMAVMTALLKLPRSEFCIPKSISCWSCWNCCWCWWHQ